jgi:hypothetical protein
MKKIYKKWKAILKHISEFQVLFLFLFIFILLSVESVFLYEIGLGNFSSKIDWDFLIVLIL